jgi:Fe-S cluster assembly ATP-binding protein
MTTTATTPESNQAKVDHELVIEGLCAEVVGRQVLFDVDLTVRSGEVHVVMGPNGSGKSTLAHALMGRPGTTVTSGSVRLDGTELIGLPSWQRARAGLFLALQQPIEVPGVTLAAMLGDATAGLPGAPSRSQLEVRLRQEAEAIGFEDRFLSRPLNVDLSGGERKRNEMVQLGVLRPPFCVLDEIDSGLDVDALGAVARRLESATSQWGLGVVAVTHFQRLLVELKADAIHVLVGGRIVASGGPELASELERTGYTAYGT